MHECLVPTCSNDWSHLGDVIGVDAVYGVADVLRGGHDDGEGQHAGRGQAIVEPQHSALTTNEEEIKARK